MTTRASNIPFFYLLTLLGFLAAYYPVLQGLVAVWSRSEDYSHGFFVIPLSLYVLWCKKGELQQVSIQVSWTGLLFLMGSLALYIFAVYSGVKSVASLSMVSSLACSVWFLFGWSMLRGASFPLLFLLFMIPVPEQMYSTLTVPLQLLVSKASVSLTALFDVPVFREGNVIHLPDKTFEVVRACSGIRSLVTLLCLCSIIAYFCLRNNFLRFILLFSGVPVAIFVNIFRVFLMIAAYRYYKMDLSEGSLHTVIGVVIFVLSLIIVNLIKGVLVRWDVREKKLRL
jgi:exosortase A